MAENAFPWSSLALSEFTSSDNTTLFYHLFYQQQFYPNSRIHAFAGPSSSHFAWMENYAEFNALLNDFIFD